MWQSCLGPVHPRLARADPALLPMVVRPWVFQVVSAAELAHPGRWFALCARAQRYGLRVGVYDGWQPQMAGNPVGDRKHQEELVETLWGDALEGLCLYFGMPGSRRERGRSHDGWHPLRRFDLLDAWRACAGIVAESMALGRWLQLGASAGYAFV
ncbi:MAG: hypothetical protein IRZ33_08585 [Alicyclobacillaceae bacterium]|nr:hypothetical protein [Alicyclobacillaceae bacterium]